MKSGIWNRVRTASEIEATRFRSLSSHEANLAAYYKCDHLSGTVLQDYTHNANNGTLVNGGLFEESYAMVRPASVTIEEIGSDTFTVHWTAPETGSAPTKYYLDVDNDSDFNSPLSGYDNKDMGTATSLVVTGLDVGSLYHSRVRAYKDSTTGQSTSTLADPTRTSIFNVTTDPFQDLYYGDAAFGDYDNDGDLDLVLCGKMKINSDEPQFTSLYRNDSGTYTQVSSSIMDLCFCTVDWGDYDNDGDLDLLMTGQTQDTSLGSTNHTVIYRNNNGTFEDIGAGLAGVSRGSADWIDLDGDGDLDVSLTGLSDNTYLYYNNDGVFEGFSIDSLDVDYFEPIDFDNDGDVDFIMGETYSPTLVYRNDDGQYTSVDVGLPDGTTKAEIADFDGDGDLDIALLIGSYTFTIYRNDNGTFQDIGADLPLLSGSDMVWGDVTNNGYPDLILTGLGGDSAWDTQMVYTCLNEAGSFTCSLVDNIGYVGSLALGDMDNDNDLDMLALSV